jgi:hypothetical protein
MVKKLCFLADFKKLHYKIGLVGLGRKKLARKQDMSGFSVPDIWTRQDRYIILMEGPNHGIGVLPAYSTHCHP